MFGVPTRSAFALRLPDALSDDVVCGAGAVPLVDIVVVVVVVDDVAVSVTMASDRRVAVMRASRYTTASSLTRFCYGNKTTRQSTSVGETRTKRTNMVVPNNKRDNAPVPLRTRIRVRTASTTSRQTFPVRFARASTDKSNADLIAYEYRRAVASFARGFCG
jgi:hypothetical protein